ncbi:MAG: type II secretion system F family protein [Actinomycetes bacterium]
MTAAVAAVAGLLIFGGALVLMAGLHRSWPPREQRSRRSGPDLWAKLSRRPYGPRGRRRDRLLVISLAAGLVVALVSGWVIAIAVLPALALGLPYLLVLPKPRDVEIVESLDRWVRALAAALTTGKSITDAIRISRRTAPPLLADELTLLVARLNNRWDTREALLKFADALDSPDADGVVAALILATNRGTTGASTTLHALADSLQDQLRGRRLIETERSKPYIVVRQVTVITLVTMALMFAFNPQFFAPYRTPLGQVILSILVTAYVASLVLMRRKARHQERPRILVGVGR